MERLARVSMRMRKLEIAFFGGLLGAVVCVAILRWAIVRLDDSHQFPVAISTLFVCTSVGVFLAAIGPITAAKWTVSAFHQFNHAFRIQPGFRIAALIHGFLAILVSSLLFRFAEYWEIGVPLTMLIYLTIAFGLWNCRNWAVGIGPQGLVMAISVISTILIIRQMTRNEDDLILLATFFLTGFVSVCTYAFFRAGHTRNSSLYVALPVDVATMLRFAMLNAFSAIVATVILAAPVMTILVPGFDPTSLMLYFAWYGLLCGGILIPAGLGIITGCTAFVVKGRLPSNNFHWYIWGSILCALPALVLLAILVQLE